MRPSEPEARHMTALRAIANLERGTFRPVIERDARECCAAGWAIEAPGDGQYRLTEAGREMLAKASELEG
jgi:hypothetical protein